MNQDNTQKLVVIVVLAYIIFPLALNAPLTRIADPDGLYHLAHGQVYLEHGPLFSGFPWHSVGAFSELDGDLWYGFHLFAIPFGLADDPVMGLKLATSACLAGSLIMMYFACRMLRTPAPWLWPILSVIIGPLHFWRELVFRPYLLSVGLAALCFASLVTNKHRMALLTAALVPLVHASFFWLPIVIAAVVAFTSAQTSRDWRAAVNWQYWLVIPSVFVGLIARPAPLDTLRLLKIQLLDLSAARKLDVPLHFGFEVSPVTLPEIASTYWVPLALMVLTGGLFFRTTQLASHEPTT